MYKIYRINSEIEFKRGVKSKILIALSLIAATLIVLFYGQILEVMIAGL